MKFKLQRRDIIFLSLSTLIAGCMQVITPLMLRVLIDGIIPSKDKNILFLVLGIIAMNEVLLLFNQSILNKKLDVLESEYVKLYKDWILSNVISVNKKIKDLDRFYDVWVNDLRRLVYKKIKNPWFRAKDFTVLFLLSFICLNISHLTGVLIFTLLILSFAIVKYSQSRQNIQIKQMVENTQKEKIVLKNVLIDNQIHELDQLQEISNKSDYFQLRISEERSRFQNINNSIRIILMFSILGFGGFLFSQDKITMGSLWALVITMYRLTPPVQSIARWLLQSKSEINLEKRILEALETKVIFQKPAYYNRLVKIIEKSLIEPGKKVVVLNKTISKENLRKSLELWVSYYSKKDTIKIDSDPIEDTQLIFCIEELKNFKNLIYFTWDVSAISIDNGQVMELN